MDTKLWPLLNTTNGATTSIISKVLESVMYKVLMYDKSHDDSIANVISIKYIQWSHLLLHT